jgi:hypothetical protein
MALVLVQLHGKPTVAEVVRESTKTVWVCLRDGHVIKRHRVKHAVDVVRD